MPPPSQGPWVVAFGWAGECFGVSTECMLSFFSLCRRRLDLRQQGHLLHISISDPTRLRDTVSTHSPSLDPKLFQRLLHRRCSPLRHSHSSGRIGHTM